MLPLEANADTGAKPTIACTRSRVAIIRLRKIPKKLSLWAGTGLTRARSMAAGDLVAALVEEMDTVLAT